MALGTIARLVLFAVLSAATVPPADAADAEAGARLFGARCATCHAVEPGRNRAGPSLFGVVGRGAGTVAGFRYSSALRESGLTWDAETLDRFLAGPRALVPGTSKAMPGIADDETRADLIAYLKTLR